VRSLCRVALKIHNTPPDRGIPGKTYLRDSMVS
jgi:N-dimethylarginine dimethylaminohydrolase